MGTVGLVGVLDLGAAGGLDDEEDDEEDDDEAAGAGFLAAAASASRELVRGAVGGFMRALGGMLAVGTMFLCGLIFFLDGGREGESMCERQGERWGEVFMGSVLLPASQDKESLVKSSKSPDAEYVRNKLTLSLFYLSTSRD